MYNDFVTNPLNRKKINSLGKQIGTGVEILINFDNIEGKHLC